MVGIIVDAQRMHLTKTHWQNLLQYLSEETGHQIVELHTRNFYAGNGVFRDLYDRQDITTAIFEWLAERKHHVVYASVVKQSYHQARQAGDIPAELNTVWRFLGFHLVLAMQRHCQREAKLKGHTIFVFDNEERERLRFTDLIHRPPAWSDAYYDRGRRQKQLDQVVDIPYFADSRDAALIQLADFAAFFLRRYAEIREGIIGPRYADEAARVAGWVHALAGRRISGACIYPKKDREYAHELFFGHAPVSVRELG
jgi:hypothetical protein